MIFSSLKRLFSRSKSNSNRPVEGAESMFIVGAVAPVAAIHPSEADDTEAVEGNTVDPESDFDSSGGESGCGASCGAMFR